MHIVMAYIGVILIWSTTPLAMKWSTEEVGFMFALVSRMGIGAAIAVLFCCMMGKKLPVDHKALKTYAASGTFGYLAMMGGYWSVQHIPSGWISVIFGISPIITSLIASRMLGERSVGIMKTGALLLSLGGLWVMFQESLQMGDQVFYGIVVAATATIFHSLGIVSVKKINADITPAATMTGSLITLATLFLATWYIGDFETPATIPIRPAGAILYLGLVGSVLGFMLFFFVLRNTDATRASLITLITPGSALLLGHLLNDEPLTADIALGAAMVVGGLLLFQFGRGIKTLDIKQFVQTLRHKPDTLYKPE